ncbi:MAG TPA: exodeoxyribonuclease VII large subunit, partial [Gammaproteobacteria bacterium]|nr:exodeoxyribonuclease VII large subunit [Gammaproteobacteria bacterium]
MPDLFDKLPSEKIYAVSELNRLVRGLLENKFTDVQIEGEIANLSKPASGHLYFSLKDDSAQLRCAMFRNRSFGLRYKPQSGDQVIARGKISLYEARGDYQFIIDTLQPAGAGALQQAFDALKEKLLVEGLFDQSRKKALPSMAKKIAVITSPSGAAIRDILQVLGRRFPLLEVVIYPVPVQGTQSAPAICEALERADQQVDIDIILLSRGGGS